MTRRVPDRIRWAVEHVDVQPDHDVLEIGCGAGVAAGLVCDRLTTGHLLAIDRSPAAVRRATERNVRHIAAGLLTVALGFAAQTSASNLISGLFLLGERPFVVGDVIRLASGITGEVVGIDLLSVKIRTFDNLLVRVPNETLLKSELTNLTRSIDGMSALTASPSSCSSGLGAPKLVPRRAAEAIALTSAAGAWP